MSRKHGTFASVVLSAIGEATGFFRWPPEGSNAWIRQQIKGRKNVYDTIYNLKKKGLVKEISKNGKRFLELTKKGEMEILFVKAHLLNPKLFKWDGKWREIIFDIPEDAKDKRDKLRRLLKQNNFVKLQASVFISPYPLNRAAIAYLKETGLIEFIRLARIDELDQDQDLRKKFKLA